MILCSIFQYLRIELDYPLLVCVEEVDFYSFDTKCADPSLGAAYNTQLFSRPINILTDIKLPNDNDLRYGVGAEY